MIIAKMGSLTGNISYKRNMRSVTASYPHPNPMAPKVDSSNQSTVSANAFVYEGNHLLFLDNNEKKRRKPSNQMQSPVKDSNDVMKLPHLENGLNTMDSKEEIHNGYNEKEGSNKEYVLNQKQRNGYNRNSFNNEQTDSYAQRTPNNHVTTKTQVSFMSPRDNANEHADEITQPKRRESHLAVVSPRRPSRTSFRKISTQLMRSRTLPAKSGGGFDLQQEGTRQHENKHGFAPVSGWFH